MQSERFLNKVTAFIRSKEAQVHVYDELKHHIEHSKNAWLKKGYTPDEAERKAIDEMGSPSALGKSMDKIHRPKVDWLLISLVAILLGASFIPILTFDSTVIFGADMTNYFIRNKWLHLLCAVLLIAALMYIDYRKLERFSLAIYLGALILLMILNYFPTAMVSGQSYLMVGPIQIQVWTVLPLLLIAWAGFFTQKKFKSWQLIILFVLPLWFILRAPNLTAALIYAGVVTILFYLSDYSLKSKILTSITVIGLIASAVFLMTPQLHHYQLVRIYAFLNPESYATQEGYIYLAIKNALNEAGWFGAETIRYIPEGHTDFALVQLIQEFGYIAGIAVVTVLFAIAIRILWEAKQLTRSYGKMLVIGAVSFYCMQFGYSVAMILGWLPIIGLSLPFISYGFTSLLINSFVIGTALSVYRRKTFIGSGAQQN
ncbi:Cell division protein FtsW [Solibacillus isronensis B3W22]|uniref:Cell division protein FtsW n=1 Tax=Solibacillus isronensis B3W22 TaxID=1224748 RepID=K1LP01_9BACL|nr:FtsW/RodA/SpoVE family cell cycle protein [Solibacillus isronensis]AMO86168.1 cell division protein [Solibacillus silvestris]EKB45844.1 Cell division protein FtsW [Solibacillus isronensis B3W22]